MVNKYKIPPKQSPLNANNFTVKGLEFKRYKINLRLPE